MFLSQHSATVGSLHDFCSGSGALRVREIGAGLECLKANAGTHASYIEAW